MPALKSYTLRVSVLENCQLSCSYCVPHHKAFLSKNSWLTPEQYKVVCNGLKILPITKIRFTGGEPLLRRELPNIIKIFHDEFPHATLALTTNGLRFFQQADLLKDAGLHQITFHLDSLHQNKYQEHMGNGRVLDVTKAIQHAKDLGFIVKLNTVVQKGINDDEICSFLYFAKEQNITVRFIELMNTGSAKNHVLKHFMSGQDILVRIKRSFTVISRGRSDIHSPAKEFFLPELNSSFGLIASDTEPFCDDCNRLRLSADGHLRGCLYELKGVSLVDSSLEMSKSVMEKVGQKASFHPLRQKKSSNFSMAQIGG